MSKMNDMVRILVHRHKIMPVDQLISINIKEINFPKNPSGKEWLPSMKSLYVGLKNEDR